VMVTLWTNAIDAVEPQKGLIKVVCRYEADERQTVIDVIDNGVGVSAADSDRVKGAGIGLRNVNERLRVIYGANYQLQLDSVPGEGTCARIVIPEMAVASRITA